MQTKRRCSYVCVCTVHRREVTPRPVEKLECDRAGSLELPSSASQPPVCLKPGSHVLESRTPRPFRKSRSCMPRETFLLGRLNAHFFFFFPFFSLCILYVMHSKLFDFCRSWAELEACKNFLSPVILQSSEISSDLNEKWFTLDNSAVVDIHRRSTILTAYYSECPKFGGV